MVTRETINLADTPTPPRPVLIAISMLAAEFGLALVRDFLMRNWSRPHHAVIGVFLIAAICLLWLYGLLRRRNWVRWLTVIIGAVGCALAPFSVARIHDPVQLLLYWIQFTLTLPATVILVLPAARRWYTTSPKTVLLDAPPG